MTYWQWRSTLQLAPGPVEAVRLDRGALAASPDPDEHAADREAVEESRRPVGYIRGEIGHAMEKQLGEAGEDEEYEAEGRQWVQALLRHVLLTSWVAFPRMDASLASRVGILVRTVKPNPNDSYALGADLLFPQGAKCLLLHGKANVGKSEFGSPSHYCVRLGKFSR